MTFEPHPQCEGEMSNLEGLGQRSPRSREMGPRAGSREKCGFHLGGRQKVKL